MAQKKAIRFLSTGVPDGVKRKIGDVVDCDSEYAKWAVDHNIAESVKAEPKTKDTQNAG